MRSGSYRSSCGRMNASSTIGCYGGIMASTQRPRRVRLSPNEKFSLWVSALILIAVTTLVLSAMAISPSDGGNQTADKTKQTGQADKNARQPQPPHLVQGMVYEADGITPVPNCAVYVTNKRTGDSNLTYTDPDYGWYEFDLNTLAHGWLDGDMINVTGISNSSKIGWNEGQTSQFVPALTLDIILSGVVVIPEFPVLMFPLLGMVALFASAGRERRRGSAR